VVKNTQIQSKIKLLKSEIFIPPIKMSIETEKIVTTPTSGDEEKIVVFLKAVGNAPILKTKKFKIASNNPFKVLQAKLRGFLSLKPSDSLVID
jgi:hypothetical protein